MPKRLILRTRAPVADSPYIGKPKDAEYEQMKRGLAGMSEYGVRAHWAEAFGREAPPEAKRYYLEIGLLYHALRSGNIRVTGKCPEVIERRYRLAKALDVRGLRKESDFLTDEYEGESGGDNKMKTKKDNDKRTGKERRRITAGSVLIKILSLAKVPDDEAIIEQVKTETGSSLFDAKQLAWYKWKYRQGKLKGQDGKQHVIAQGDPKKEVKAKASKNGHSKKKVVVKRKAKEAAAV